MTLLKSHSWEVAESELDPSSLDPQVWPHSGCWVIVMSLMEFVVVEVSRQRKLKRCEAYLGNGLIFIHHVQFCEIAQMWPFGLK